METDDIWGPWNPQADDAYQRLARYANAEIAPLTRHGLWVEGGQHEREEDPRGLLADLYETLRDKRIAYEKVPVGAGTEQIIRDVRTVDRGCATCLDLVLLFAAMCKHKRLRPYIVLGASDGERSGHALLLVDLRPVFRTPELGVQRRDDARRRCRPLEDAVTRDGEEHVYRWKPNAAALNPDVLVIDVTQACSKPGADFATACAQGRAQLLGTGYRSLVMIDVIALHADRYQPLAFQPERQMPAITRRLAARPRFFPYAARQNLLDELVGATGTVVLQGEQGTGKSMLAHQIAAKAQHGAGWFLTANDNAVLTAELGDAEMSETGQDPAEVDRLSRSTFAKLAKARLRNAPGSWVVVLDNVDVAPGELTAMPEPQPQLGQLVIVTTTDPRWLEHRPGVMVRRLGPLPKEDVVERLGPNVPLEALAGRPLLIGASQRFRGAAGGRDWWTGRGEVDADRAPHAFWAAVREELAAAAPDDRAALGLAAALAWLPPSGMDLDTVAPVVAAALSARGEAADPARIRTAAAQLDRLGMVDLREGRILMHRLMRDAVREDVRGGAAPRAAALVGTVLEQLFATVDTVGYEILRDAGGPLPEEDVAPPYGLLLEAEDVSGPHGPGALEDLLGEHPEQEAAERALHALAGLVERQNEQAAARMLRRLAGQARQAVDRPAGARLIAVNALRAEARVVTRTSEPPLPELDRAIALMEECRALCADPPGDPALHSAFRLAGARAEALYGLALQKRAKHLPEAERLGTYLEAERILRASADARAELVGPNSPDRDRSLYNLGGLFVQLAKHDVPQARSRHLDAADDVYQRVLNIREKRLNTRYLEEAACCVHGRGIVAYYRALLLPLSPQQRTAQLREAADHAREADELRAHAEGQTDGGNTVKAVTLSAKIALARLDLAGVLAGKPDSAAANAVKELGIDKALGPFLLDKLSGIESRTMPLTFPSVPLATGDGVLSAVDAWIRSSAMRALVTAFDGDEKSLMDGDRGLADCVEALYAFSERWQNRADYQERNEGAELPMTPHQEDVVLAATAALGLHDCPPPRRTDYDHVLLLGGLVRACFNRPAYAAQLLDSGRVKTKSVTALGGHRPFRGSKDPSDDEFKLAERIGHPELAEEYQALDIGTRAAFGLGEADHEEGERTADVGGTWGVRHYTRADGTPVRVAAAPSSDPGARRAHTGDTYAFFAERMEQLRPGARLLLVTTPIYAPSQHFTALHRLALPYQVEVETVGGDPAGLSDALRQPFSATRYLAEVRTALRSLRGLVGEATRTTLEA